ncbi:MULTISPECIES: hypothetical protein [unclassified Fusibacter]|uniref:hypothetical protein n=1 Tax=unclassified Fusibacter TaxID=2624464 RepID=UPI00101042FF|nr:MULTISPECIES: hypothetical protein [unclassified Fusibacter]MCK8061495.1 hypothetical protein [Fusibacter sp. A2]NPE23680.1 hypothetical protein [Fusibacter sp. A1]RXV58858.1 hypothetical protein DWB64_18000 [Fusibacter sp. A1]
MKKLMALALTGIMALSTFAFADEFDAAKTDDNLKGKPGIEKQLGSRPEKGEKPGKEKHGNMEERMAKMTEVIENYAPDLLEDFEANWEAHQEIREELDAIKEDLRESHKEEMEPIFEEIKALVESGELTREEAKEDLMAIREENKADFESVRSDIDALREAYGVDKDAAKAVHEALTAAVEADDAQAVTSALTEILNMMQNHLQFEEAKLDYLNNL